ncbi:MAG: DUF2797 domain-containing protein [Chloroflexi bacterium]|nr:DUF2797 domain-containing protein [Chloroflexota bacterium]
MHVSVVQTTMRAYENILGRGNDLMDSKQLHVIGYTWKDERIFLEVCELTSNATTTFIPIEEAFIFKKTQQRRCIGWIDFENKERQPCPDLATVKQCDFCKQREGFLPCVMCNGFDCPPLKPSVEAYCQRPHSLYLACFGSDRVKVGTASEGRKYVRLHEQGPLAAMLVAKASGPLIKQMEAIISRMGYTEAMRTSTKQKLLTSGMTENEAKQHLLKALEDILSRIPVQYETYFQEPEHVKIPPLALAARQFRELEALKPEVDQILGGHVVAASGNFLVFQDNVGAMTLDLSALRSWVIEMNPDGQPAKRTKQLSLF